jgi:hypothetical protein
LKISENHLAFEANAALAEVWFGPTVSNERTR